jgi:hypothetical protein
LVKVMKEGPVASVIIIRKDVMNAVNIETMQ